MFTRKLLRVLFWLLRLEFVGSETEIKMGFFSTILGFCGFGVGISLGLVIGYVLFVYLLPNDVKVRFFLRFEYF